MILSWSTGAIALGYLVLQIAYTLGLKQLAFVDVLVIAAGFLLRVLVGAHAIAVPASGWVLLCTALLATFLGLGKRAHELTWATRAGTGEATRAAAASRIAATTAGAQHSSVTPSRSIRRRISGPSILRWMIWRTPIAVAA